MRRIYALGASAAIALAAATAIAGGASAAPLAGTKVLDLESPTKFVLGKGAEVITTVEADACPISMEGLLASNGKSSDTLAFTGPKASDNSVCEISPEFTVTLSGTLKSVSLTAAGKATYTGTFTLTLPGPCVYSFTKVAVAEKIPGVTSGSGSITLKVRKAASVANCGTPLKVPVKASDEIEFDLNPENVHEPEFFLIDTSDKA